MTDSVVRSVGVARRRGHTLVGASALLAISCAVVLPFVSAGLPLLQDYPNHLARLHILANPGDPALAQHYEIRWQVLPNLAFDGIGLLLAQVMAPAEAGRVFVVASILLIITGVALVNHALHGRLTAGPFFAAFFLINLALWKAFLSYLFAVGLALCLIAAWGYVRDKSPTTRAALGVVFSVSLFFAHLYALGFYLIFTLADELSTVLQGRGGRLRQALGRLGPWGVQVLVPLILFFAFSPTSTTGGSARLLADVMQGLQTPGWPASELLLAISVYRTVAPLFSLLVIVFFGVALVWMLVAAERRGGLGLRLRCFLAFALLTFGLFFFMPFRLMGSFNADWRLLVPLVFVVTAMLPQPPHLRRVGVALALLATAATLVKVALVDQRITAGRADLAAYLALEEHIEPGSRVFAFTRCTPRRRIAEFPYIQHLPALTVINRQVLLSSLFASPGAQPVDLRDLPERFRGIQERYPLQAGPFDYAVWMERPLAGEPACAPPAGWRPVAAEGPFTLLEPDPAGGRPGP